MPFRTDQGICVCAERAAADGGEANVIEMADEKQGEDFLLSLMLSCFLLVQALLCS